MICNVDPINEFYLGQQLKNNSPLILDIHTSLTTNDADCHYDLLLTDFKICQNSKIKSSYQYTWDFPPCIRDWDNIYTIIDKIKEEHRLLYKSQVIDRT